MANKSFNDWFESLSPEERKEYVEDMEADVFIEEQKSFPEVDNN